MKNTELLKKLLKIEKNGSVNLDSDFISLLNDVKMEVYNDEKGFTSTEKKANKKAAAFLKKLYKKRPVLSICDFQNKNGIEYQVFTDSFIVFYMKRHYKLETINNLNEREKTQYSFPNMIRFLPNQNEGLLIESSKEILNDAMKKYKVGMLDKLGEITTYVINYKGIKITVDMMKLKTVIEIMGTMDLDIYIYGSFKPLLFIDNKTGNKAILLPLRTY